MYGILGFTFINVGIWEREKFDIVPAILPTKATNRVKARGIIKILPMPNRTRGDVLTKEG